MSSEVSFFLRLIIGVIEYIVSLYDLKLLYQLKDREIKLRKIKYFQYLIQIFMYDKGGILNKKKWIFQ